MNWFWTILLGGIALSWIIQGSIAAWGMSHLAGVNDPAALNDHECPSISVLFAARDEAAKLPQSLPTLLAQDYRRYEVIAVDDRSQDGTGEILENFARQNEKLRVLRIGQLPPGWLGKPYALASGYQHARGEWLVFTDADVRFAPDLLRQAMALAREKGWDHLTLLADVETPGFWEKIAVGYFGLAFVLGIRPWRVNNPRAGSYMGVGAFQLIRRPTYEAIGTHRRLAMEVVDDMKLGRLVKLGGFRSGVASGHELVHVRWQEGLSNIVHGLTKNIFAGLGFSVKKTLISVLGVLAISVVPFLALFFGHGAARLLATISVVFALMVQGSLFWGEGKSPAYAIFQPLGALIFCYIMLRSMVITLWRGGVVWRDTFYPLDELRKGRV